MHFLCNVLCPIPPVSHLHYWNPCVPSGCWDKQGNGTFSLSKFNFSPKSSVPEPTCPRKSAFLGQSVVFHIAYMALIWDMSHLSSMYIW